MKEVNVKFCEKADLAKDLLSQIEEQMALRSREKMIAILNKKLSECYKNSEQKRKDVKKGEITTQEFVE